MKLHCVEVKIALHVFTLSKNNERWSSKHPQFHLVIYLRIISLISILPIIIISIIQFNSRCFAVKLVLLILIIVTTTLQWQWVTDMYRATGRAKNGSFWKLDLRISPSFTNYCQLSPWSRFKSWLITNVMGFVKIITFSQCYRWFQKSTVGRYQH